MAFEQTTAIVLCGGKGTRLRPITDSVPKPLVEIQGRPILHYVLKNLSSAGIRKAILCTGYRADLIEKYVSTNRPEGLSVNCVNSGDAGMTDRILDCLDQVPSRALICYGDTLAQVDVKSLHTQHEKTKASATLTVYPLRSPFGVVNFDDKLRIQSFAEKPLLPYWINIGFLLVEKKILEAIPRRSTMEAFLEKLTQSGNFYVYRHSGKHLTINNEKELKEAEKSLLEFYTVGEDEAA